MGSRGVTMPIPSTLVRSPSTESYATVSRLTRLTHGIPENKAWTLGSLLQKPHTEIRVNSYMSVVGYIG